MSKKPWCLADNDAACNCRLGECWAERNKAYLDKINMLARYGLEIEEVAEDMKGEVLKP